MDRAQIASQAIVKQPGSSDPVAGLTEEQKENYYKRRQIRYKAQPDFPTGGQPLHPAMLWENLRNNR